MKTMGIKKEKFIIISCSFLAGFLVSQILVKKLSMWFILHFLLASCVIYILVQYIVWRLVRMSHRGNSDITDFMLEIYKLSFDEAKEKAEELLKDNSRFICIKAERGLPEEIAALDTSISEFFEKYKRIKRVDEDAILGWDHVGESEYMKGFTRIGIDTDFVEYAVRTNIEGVYELDGLQHSIKDVEDTKVPSVYHLILMIDKSYSK